MAKTNNNRERFHTTIDKDLLKAFKIIAIEKNRNVNELIEASMKNYISKENDYECIKRISSK